MNEHQNRQQVDIELPQLPSGRTRAQAILAAVHNKLADTDVTIDCRQVRTDTIGSHFVDELTRILLVDKDDTAHSMNVVQAQPTIIAQFLEAADQYNLTVGLRLENRVTLYPQNAEAQSGTRETMIGQELTDPVKFAEEAHATQCLDNHSQAECAAMIFALHFRDLMPRIGKMEARYQALLSRVDQVSP